MSAFIRGFPGAIQSECVTMIRARISSTSTIKSQLWLSGLDALTCHSHAKRRSAQESFCESSCPGAAPVKPGGGGAILWWMEGGGAFVLQFLPLNLNLGGSFSFISPESFCESSCLVVPAAQPLVVFWRC